MMNKLAFFLALILALSLGLPAFAEADLPETRDFTFDLEGQPEQATLTLARGEIAPYALYYDPQFFAFIPASQRDAASSFYGDELAALSNQSDSIVASVYFSILDGEAQKNYDDTLASGEYEPLEPELLPSAAPLGATTAEDDVYSVCYWLPLPDNTTLYIHANIALEALEGYGARLDHLMSTLTLLNP